MNRRSFFKSLIKASVTIAVAPSILAEVAKVKPVHIIELEFNGHKYWMDHQMFLTERKFYEDIERQMFSFGYTERIKDITNEFKKNKG